jgi:hypothetical protein
MVDVLGRSTAVLARVTVTRKDRSSVEGDPSGVWDFDEGPQPDDCGQQMGGTLRMPNVAAVLDDHRFLA